MSAVKGTLHPWDTLHDALRLFSDARADGVPVVDGRDKVVGILTRSHFYRALLRGCSLSEAVDFHMSAGVVAIGAEASLDTILDQVRRIRVGQVVVCEPDGRPVGMLTKVDVIRLLLRETDFLTGELLGVLEAMRSGVIAVDREGRVTLVNAAAVEMLARPRSDMVGRPADEVVPGIPLFRVVATGELDLGRYRELPGGRRVVANSSPIRLGGQVAGAIAVLEDLTEYEAVASELESTRRLQETLQTVLDIAYDGIVVVDESGIIRMVNQAMAGFLGMSRESMLGRHCGEVIPGSRLPEALRSGMTQQAQIETIGNQRYVASRIPIVRNGKIVGAVEKVLFRNLEELRRLVRRLDMLEGQVAYYKGELERVGGARYGLDDIVGVSDCMRRLKAEAERVARTDATVLLLGESGTGKELFAHAIHAASPRSRGPFVKVNCAAVPADLLESEFFGYAEGAFTGARKGGKPGKFELATGGTVFLDEVGDMSTALQAKILNVLQDREVVRLGGTKPVPVDVRVVAASNRDLEAMVQEGGFRADLYYRLNVVCLRVPPLRERPEDILPLAWHLLDKYLLRLGRHVEVTVSPAAARALQSYIWPGNVRELENAIERAISLEVQDTLEEWHLPEVLRSSGHDGGPTSGSAATQRQDPVAQRPAVRRPGQRAGQRPGERAADQGPPGQGSDEGKPGKGKPGVGKAPGEGSPAGKVPPPMRRLVWEAECQAIATALERTGGNRSAAARLLGLSRSRFYAKLRRCGLH